jgi:hypothetical protein
MTTLRTFQNEIEEIQTREAAKQRAQVTAASAEKQLKENKIPRQLPTKGKSKDEPTGSGDVETTTKEGGTPDLAEAEEQVQVSYKLPG